VLSGAGPSLLAVADGDATAAAVSRAMEETLEHAGVKGAARSLAVDTLGAASWIIDGG
jgi:homoserine kinase